MGGYLDKISRSEEYNNPLYVLPAVIDTYVQGG